MSIRPIRSESDYNAALERADHLFDAIPGTPEYDELDVLVTLIQAYERLHYPMGDPETLYALDRPDEYSWVSYPIAGHYSRVHRVSSESSVVVQKRDAPRTCSLTTA
jgi:antitoxin component HigA of HigAB toxin-antitoxin module